MPDPLFEQLIKRAQASPSGSVKTYSPFGTPQDAMDLAKLHVQGSMPKEAAAVGSITPFGWISRLINGKGTVATTSPSKNIQYDPEYVKGLSQPMLDEILAHELTHVGQFDKKSTLKNIMGLFSSLSQPDYLQRPAEQEAFAREAEYAASHGKDIQLPSKR